MLNYHHICPVMNCNAELSTQSIKNLAALFNAEMQEFSEISSVCGILKAVYRFAHVSTYLQMCKFAHVCKSVHVNPFTHVSKIYFICNNFTFDPSQDQVQILFALMQILLTCKSCP